MASDVFADAGQPVAARPLTVLRTDLIACDQMSWEELLGGFTVRSVLRPQAMSRNGAPGLLSG